MELIMLIKHAEQYGNPYDVIFDHTSNFGNQK